MTSSRQSRSTIKHYVDDLKAEIARLHKANVNFRNDISTGTGGSEILLDEPSGNPVELFQPAGMQRTKELLNSRFTKYKRVKNFPYEMVFSVALFTDLRYLCVTI